MGPARWSKASPMLFLAAVDRLGLGCYATVYAMCNIAYPIGMMATNALASVVAAELGFMDTLFMCRPKLAGLHTILPAKGNYQGRCPLSN